MTTDIFKPDLTQSSQTIDPTGLLINSTDYHFSFVNNVYSSLNYTYFSSGHDASVILNGNTVNTFTYDQFGRQTNMWDANFPAGDTYVYNAYNQLVSQVDPNGDTYTMAYDVLGRITSKVSSLEGTYNYYYYTSGTSLNMLHYEQAPNGNRVTYAYDNLRRPAQISVNGLTTKYAYDAFSNVISKTLSGRIWHY